MKIAFSFPSLALGRVSRILYLGLIVLFTNFQSLAQHDLFSVIDESFSPTLTEEQSRKYGVAASMQGVLGIWLVEFTEISQLEEGEEIILDLPNWACDPKLSTLYYNATSDSTWAYSAEVDEPEYEADTLCFDGYMNLHIWGNAVSGSINVNTHLFEIHHIGSGLEVLIERALPDNPAQCGNSQSNDSSAIAPS